MGRREKQNVKVLESSSSEEDRIKRKVTLEAADSDDDAEANEDLTLKIVQKFLQRAANNEPRDNGISEIVTDLKEEKKKKKKKRKREKKRGQKSKEVEVPEDSVSRDIDTDFRDFCGDLVDNVKDKDDVEEEEKPETCEATEVSTKAVETNPVEVSDNSVLRKLLRGPRYFDPPNSSWGACYNCGEEGHTTVNCTSAKRKKPCFVCGSFEHNAKQCSKGRDCCFICNQQGHRAKDCPEKYKSSKICLKCGDLGHEMFACRNDYCPDDIKEIQCYICRKFGHLCCVNYSDPGPAEVSCYRCGLSGHTGLACNGSRSHGDTYNTAVASSCYKCGVEGHFARECTSSVKAGKRDREPSTPKQRPYKKKKDHMEPYSAPHDLGKTQKKNKSQFREFASGSRTKHRRGWTTEYPDDSYGYQTNANNYWGSPSNSSHRRNNFASPNGYHTPSSYSSQKTRKLSFNNSSAGGSSRSYQHRYSASRFNYYNENDGRGRNYNWW
ncbi:hypothetical protein OROMI_029701 [Orobanche minor]